MLLLGFSGKAHSGKDTALKLISNKLAAINMVKIAWAEKLKDFCADVFYWDRQRLDYDIQYKETNLLDNGEIDPACKLFGFKSRRDAMQRVGTEGLRNGITQDFWILSQQMKIINHEYDAYQMGVVSDCRFLNEIEFVKRNNGILVKIVAPHVSTLDSDDHASETEWTSWTDWDFIVENPFDPTDVASDTSFIEFEKNLRPLVALIKENLHD